MRIVKQADERKAEILDAAAALFAEKGFDGTSTVDIMNAVAIAKGTLYHHFKSKEEIMDALIERQTVRILEAAQSIAEDTTLPVLERLFRTILALHVDDAPQTEGGEMLSHLHKPQNALMHQKTKRILMQRIPPLLAHILEDGIRQGLAETPYPLECMEMAFCYLDIMLDEDVLDLTPEQSACKITAFLFHLERLLHMEPGMLMPIAQAFLGKEGEGNP